MTYTLQFLSTLSLRRATPDFPAGLFPLVNFYPRSPCGERLFFHLAIQFCFVFLSTLSLRRATYFSGVMRQNPGISIHALLAESDVCSSLVNTSSTVFLSTLSLRRATRYPFGHFGHNCHFYPRSPCGERRVSKWTATWNLSFLSTLSLRRATRIKVDCYLEFVISIHALLAESD